MFTGRHARTHTLFSLFLYLSCEFVLNVASCCSEHLWMFSLDPDWKKRTQIIQIKGFPSSMPPLGPVASHFVLGVKPGCLSLSKSTSLRCWSTAEGERLNYTVRSPSSLMSDVQFIKNVIHCKWLILADLSDEKALSWKKFQRLVLLTWIWPVLFKF